MRFQEILWTCLIIVLTAIIAVPVQGNLIPYQEATEAMMNSEGLILTLAARQLGVGASGQSLIFVSNVDPVTQTFSYTLQDGSTYLGQSASLQVSGAFDNSSGTWLWTSSGHFGSTDLGGSGSSLFSGDPMSSDIFVPLSFDETIVSNVTYENTAIRTVSSGTITVKDSLFGTVKSSGTHTDQYVSSGPNKGKWEWDTGLITGKNGKFVTLNSSGFSPVPDGGLGTFTVTITLVPEPASLCLFGTAAIVGGLAWPRRNAGDSF